MGIRRRYISKKIRFMHKGLLVETRMVMVEKHKGLLPMEMPVEWRGSRIMAVLDTKTIPFEYDAEIAEIQWLAGSKT